MLHTRGFPAIIATLALALGLAACGSGSNSSAGSASSGAAKSSSADGTAGITKAAAELKPFEAAPTAITVKGALTGTPPTGKTIVMLGTNDPNNQKLQKSLKDLAGLAKWNYDVVSYDPANPATFNAAIDTAITKKANYVAEAGIPLTPAMIKKVQDAGA